MSPRTGRPHKEETLDVRIQIRADDETAKKLKKCAEKLHITQSDVVRQGIDLVLKKIEEKE